MSEETKIKLTLFQRIEKFGDLFFINLLFIISCIPIITIGAAITAMFSFTLKLAVDHEQTVWKGYWKAFKLNFKPATKAWLVILVIALVMYEEYVAMISTTGMVSAVFLSLLGLEAVTLSFILPLLFPLISRYENTTMSYFINSFLISISNLGSWVYMFFIWVLPILVYATNIKLFYYTAVLWLVIIIAVLAYAESFVLIKLFKKIDKQQEATEESRRKATEAKEKRNKKVVRRNTSINQITSIDTSSIDASDEEDDE